MRIGNQTSEIRRQTDGAPKYYATSNISTSDFRLLTSDFSTQTDVIEVIDIRRLHDEARDALANRHLLLHVADEQPRRVVDDALLRLVEKVLALGDVGLLVGRVEELINLRHAIERCVHAALVGTIEEHA